MKILEVNLNNAAHIFLLIMITKTIGRNALLSWTDLNYTNYELENLYRKMWKLRIIMELNSSTSVQIDAFSLLSLNTKSYSFT